jgi:hypothetical protein
MDLYGFMPYLSQLKEEFKFEGELFNGIHLLKMKEDICNKKPNLNEQDREKLNLLCDRIKNALKSSTNISCYRLLLQWKTECGSEPFSDELTSCINGLLNKYPVYLYWKPTNKCKGYQVKSEVKEQSKAINALQGKLAQFENGENKQVRSQKKCSIM